MSDYRSEAQKAFDYATYKQPADKIRQNLSKIYNNPASSAKRWVWELIQNAKDIPNKFGKVSIEIERVSADELVFRHNGNPFMINNIIGLIRQVSSKDSLNNDEETTGKFGTGFICTHILSDVIDVNGILDYEGHRKFNLTLDRSGRSSEELIPRIKSVETRFYEPEKSFEEIRDYEVKRSEKDFDTSFTYHLSSVEKQDSANNGIADLVNTLPITLVTQSKKIKQVRVIDKVHNKDVLYICCSEKLDDNVKLSTVSINEDNKYYLTYETTEVALTIGVTPEEDGYTLLKRDPKQPVLYRDFPLIGSEKFYFPYTLNGYRLCPTEKRDSIPLNGEDNYEAKDNREIIDKAVSAAISFNFWLTQHNAKNRYLLASSRRPQAEVDYDERIALPWIKSLQSKWRKQLLEQQLAETTDGIYALKEISVPSFAGYGETNAKATNEAFFAILNDHYLGRGHLPLAEHLHGWLDVIRPEYETWGTQLKYEKDDFLTDLSKEKSITTLSATIKKTREETIGWLNKVYNFLVEQNMMNEFDNYAIIPNQTGEFKLLKDLYSDHTSRIPAILKDIYNSVNFDCNMIQNKLMDADIDAAIFNNSIRDFSLKEMIEALNSYIKEGSSFYKNTVFIDPRSTVAYRIISLFPNSNDEAFVNKRKTMYDFSSSFREMDGFSMVDIQDHSLWTEADAYWFENSCTGIEKAKDAQHLAKEFFLQEKTIDEALTWLNGYICFYRNNGKGDFIKGRTVFPRQLSDNDDHGVYTFRKLEDLQYDNDVPEEFKDLGDYARNVNSTGDYCRQFLLHKKIRGYEDHKPYSLKDLYEYVKGVFDKSDDSTKEIIARQTISILSKHDGSESIEKKLYDFAKTVSDQPFDEAKYVDNHTGFYWGFAQEFYLKYICKRIASSVNLNGFKTLSPEFAEKNNTELTHWIDSVIEFLHSYKDKKFWPIITDKDNGIGIWLNQNNNFCLFQDVRKDDRIPDEIKDIAASNRHINRDFREELFTLDSHHASYLETSPLELQEIGEFIDDKIKVYDGNKQDKDFRALVFAIGKLRSANSCLEEIMPYFTNMRNSLIVWSLGEGETMDLVGSIVQQGDEKIKAVKELLENNSLEDLKTLKSVLQGCSGEPLDKVKELISRLANDSSINTGEDTPVGGNDAMDLLVIPKTYEIESVEGYDGRIQIVQADQIQYAGLSLEEIERYVDEAKAAVVKYFRELNDEHGLGLQFDNEKIAKHSYSQLYGISNRNGDMIPIVVHSYKGPQYRYFNLNWYDWQLLSQKNAMLFVLTVSGLQCIPLYALPVRNFNISIDTEMSENTKAALLTLAAVSKQYATLSFDFGNNMPRGFTEPVPFDYVPEKLGNCIQTIKEVCDQNIPQIAGVYNYGKNIPIIRSDVGYSLALKQYEDTGTMRDIFEAPANDTQLPSVGTQFIE